MSILQAIVLGLVQGIAEFLPISSSGHLSILQNLFNITTAEEGHMFFDVLLHLGTLVSVCVVYRRDIADMLKELVKWIKSIKDPKLRSAANASMPTRRLIVMIALATLPLIAILPVKSKIEQLYYSTIFVGVALILTGFILFVSDRMAAGHKTEKNMTAPGALIIGVCQAIATIPGLSRSGTTITAGIATGLDREFAVKFSFLISLPAILGANLINLVGAIKDGIDTSLLPAYLIGTLVAAVVGYFAIGLVRMIAQKSKFGYFAYYCWAVGAISIIASLILG